MGELSCVCFSSPSQTCRAELQDPGGSWGLISIPTVDPGQVNKGPVCLWPWEVPVVLMRFLCFAQGHPTLDTALNHPSLGHSPHPSLMSQLVTRRLLRGRSWGWVSRARLTTKGCVTLPKLLELSESPR